MERARPLAPVERSVLTISRDVVPVAVAAARIERRRRSIVLGRMTSEDLATFVPIDAVKLPDAPAYLAVDVDPGADSRNVRPEEALDHILDAGRSPLTIDEGIALEPADGSRLLAASSTSGSPARPEAESPAARGAQRQLRPAAFGLWVGSVERSGPLICTSLGCAVPVIALGLARDPIRHRLGDVRPNTPGGSPTTTIRQPSRGSDRSARCNRAATSLGSGGPRRAETGETLRPGSAANPLAERDRASEPSGRNRPQIPSAGVRIPVAVLRKPAPRAGFVVQGQQARPTPPAPPRRALGSAP